MLVGDMGVDGRPFVLRIDYETAFFIVPSKMGSAESVYNLETSTAVCSRSTADDVVHVKN